MPNSKELSPFEALLPEHNQHRPSLKLSDMDGETPIRTKPDKPRKHSKNPSDKGMRGIINKINQRLALGGLTHDQFIELVREAVHARKAIGMAGKLKEGHPRLNSDTGIFDTSKL